MGHVLGGVRWLWRKGRTIFCGLTAWGAELRGGSWIVGHLITHSFQYFPSPHYVPRSVLTTDVTWGHSSDSCPDLIELTASNGDK